MAQVVLSARFFRLVRRGELVAREGQKVPIQVNIRFSRSNIVDNEEFYGDVTVHDAKNMKNVSLTESEKDAFIEIREDSSEPPWR